MSWLKKEISIEQYLSNTILPPLEAMDNVRFTPPREMKPSAIEDIHFNEEFLLSSSTLDDGREQTDQDDKGL